MPAMSSSRCCDDGGSRRGGYEEIPDRQEQSTSSVDDLEGASSSCSDSIGSIVGTATASSSLSSGYDSVSEDPLPGGCDCDCDHAESVIRDDPATSSYQSAQASVLPRGQKRRRRRDDDSNTGGDGESCRSGHQHAFSALARKACVPALLTLLCACVAALRGGQYRVDSSSSASDRPALGTKLLDESGETSSSLLGDAALDGIKFSRIFSGFRGGYSGDDGNNNDAENGSDSTVAREGQGWGGGSRMPVGNIVGGGIAGGYANGNGDGAGGGGTVSRTFKCEYTGMPSDSVRMIQTSRSEPDRQWVSMPCLRNDDAVFAQDDAMDGAAVISLEMPSRNGDNGNGGGGKFQKIIGFGGSITEATALNWKRLSGSGQNLVLELLYGRSGLGYTLGRIPIGSCDFSVSNYAFHEKDGDFDLGTFDAAVQHDVDNGMIEMMNRAATWVRNNWSMGAELRLVASPWSPPPWMKRPTPSDPRGASHATSADGTASPECLRDGTGPDSRYARSWALYLSDFLDAYKGRGVDLWAITVQNEPGSSPKYEACGHSMSTERDFLVHHLGPVVRENHPTVKILVYDSNKDDCAEWMNYLWNNGDDGSTTKSKNAKSSSSSSETDAAQYIDGVALHWYSRSGDHALDGGEGMPNMHRLKQLASDAAEKQQQQQPPPTPDDPPLLLDTEASHCSSTGYAINDQDVSWSRAERYAHAILSQLAAGSNGWIDWNMVLDPFGGPNHADNFCDAPIIAVPHRAVNAFDIQPIPSFEKHRPEEGDPAVLGEYETKYTLSKKLGYPMAYMDAGVVVQPSYFYLGHVTRYVRPGSVPIRAVVDQSRGGTVARTFRRRGRTDPGGGRNRNARVGTEVTLWPCEGSTRQSWLFTDRGQLRVRPPSGDYDSGGGGEGCVTLSDSSDPSLGGILLTGCSDKNAAIFQLAPTGASYESMQVVKFVTQRKVNKCLGILPLANEGGAYGRRGGAQAVMVPCDHPSSLWEYFPQTGEVLSYFFSPPNENGTVCLTTGWPFLQAGAFDTSRAEGTERDSAVIVLNESDDEANFVLTLSGGGFGGNGGGLPPVLKSSIPAHSIQTYTL